MKRQKTYWTTFCKMGSTALFLTLVLFLTITIPQTTLAGSNEARLDMTEPIKAADAKIKRGQEMLRRIEEKKKKGEREKAEGEAMEKEADRNILDLLKKIKARQDAERKAQNQTQ